MTFDAPSDEGSYETKRPPTPFSLMCSLLLKDLSFNFYLLYFGMVYPKNTDLELYVVRKPLKIVQKEKLKNFMAHALVCP